MAIRNLVTSSSSYYSLESYTREDIIDLKESARMLMVSIESDANSIEHAANAADAMSGVLEVAESNGGEVTENEASLIDDVNTAVSGSSTSDDPPVSISSESNGRYYISTEAILDKIKEIWEKIKVVIASMWNKIKEFFTKKKETFSQEVKLLKNKVEEMKKEDSIPKGNKTVTIITDAKIRLLTVGDTLIKNYSEYHDYSISFGNFVDDFGGSRDTKVKAIKEIVNCYKDKISNENLISKIKKIVEDYSSNTSSLKSYIGKELKIPNASIVEYTPIDKDKINSNELKDVIEAFSNEGFSIKRVTAVIKPLKLTYPYEDLLNSIDIFASTVDSKLKEKERIITAFDDYCKKITNTVDSIIKDNNRSKEHITPITSMVSKFNNSIGTLSELMGTYTDYVCFVMRLVEDELEAANKKTK